MKVVLWHDSEQTAALVDDEGKVVRTGHLEVTPLTDSGNVALRVPVTFVADPVPNESSNILLGDLGDKALQGKEIGMTD